MRMSRYEEVQRIGKGHYGEIFLVRRQSQSSDQLFALKKITPNALHPDAEPHLLPLMHHPNIIQAVEVFQEGGDIAIVLEYAQQGDLRGYVQRHFKDETIPEDTIRSWLTQICLALHYLHSELQVVHRDIKTMNVLVTADGLLKLADFGLAKRIEKEEFARSSVGTPYYLSPETISQGRYNSKSDVWALGCLLYELCKGDKPFKGSAFGQIFDNIVNHPVEDLGKEYSRWLNDLIRSMLQKNADKRPTIQQILEQEEVRRQFLKLKNIFQQYESVSYPESSLRTTKYLEREQKYQGSLRLFSQSLKTAKKDKSIKMQMEQNRLDCKGKEKKVERVRFAERSLRSLIEKSSKALHGLQ